MGGALQQLVERTRPVSLAEERVLPVLRPFVPLFPAGGLRRGSVVSVTGSTVLTLGLLAGPSQAGSWCAAVGLPSLGLVAAAEVGIDLTRLALVAAPRQEWPDVVAVLVDAFDVVCVHPPDRVRAGDVRRLTARTRERGAILVVVGAWEGADTRLSIRSAEWEGLGHGHGHLRRRRVEVHATGRGASAKPRGANMWLPARDGGVVACEASPPQLRVVG